MIPSTLSKLGLKLQHSHARQRSESFVEGTFLLAGFASSHTAMNGGYVFRAQLGHGGLRRHGRRLSPIDSSGIRQRGARKRIHPTFCRAYSCRCERSRLERTQGCTVLIIGATQYYSSGRPILPASYLYLLFSSLPLSQTPYKGRESTARKMALLLLLPPLAGFFEVER